MKHLIYVVSLIVLYSCGTFKKELQEHKRVQSIEASALVDSVKNSTRELASIMKTKQYAYSDTGSTKIVEIKFSSPDSLGRQHKLSEKVTEHTNNIEVKAQALEQKLEEAQRSQIYWKEQYRQAHSALEAEKSLKTKTKTTPPLWLFVFCFLLGFATCYLILSKVKKLNWLGKIKDSVLNLMKKK